MGPKNIRTRQEDPAASYQYLKKAEDNYEEMISALNHKNYNAVGTLAIQCVISSADAICVYRLGTRSISQDHKDVCDLMATVSLPGDKEKSVALKRIIAKKNAIQYDCRSIHEKEAHDVAKSTKRIFEWVLANIKKK
ncbi:MAG: hypothetical protein GY858_09555 [Candidatus Omnitrophica bacterium]|nr:hypothetical protein [Candidatus Omnitrophota bacterium]